MSFTLYKESWDSIYIDKLRDIVKNNDKSDLYAVVLEEGLANICLVRNSMCFVKSRVEKLIPGKGRGTDQQVSKVCFCECCDLKAMNSFFNMIYNNVMKIIDFATVKVILLCSNGYLNKNLLRFMDSHSLAGDHTLHSNLQKFVCVHSSSGHVYALNVTVRHANDV